MLAPLFFGYHDVASFVDAMSFCNVVDARENVVDAREINIFS
jgi:hypothetical protein